MLITILFVLAVLLLVLAFAHVLSLLVGLGGALVCLVVALALLLGGGGIRRTPL